MIVDVCQFLTILSCVIVSQNFKIPETPLNKYNLLIMLKYLLMSSKSRFIKVHKNSSFLVWHYQQCSRLDHR